MAEAMQEFLRRHLKSNPLGIFGMLLLKTSLSKFKKDMDYSEYGGAPLLGVNGVVIIGHGRSNVKAIKNAAQCGIFYALNYQDYSSTLQTGVQEYPAESVSDHPKDLSHDI